MLDFMISKTFDDNYLDTALKWRKRYDRLTRWSWVRNDQWIKHVGLFLVLICFPILATIHGWIEGKEILTLPFYKEYATVYMNELIVAFIAALVFFAVFSMLANMFWGILLQDIPEECEPMLRSRANKDDPYAAFELYKQAQVKGSEFWQKNWLELAAKNKHFEAMRIKKRMR